MSWLGLSPFRSTKVCVSDPKQNSAIWVKITVVNSFMQQDTLSEALDGDLPLVFDLDGTLIKSDITFELCLLHLKAHPITGWWRLFTGFRADKAATKALLSQEHGAELAVQSLPFSDVLGHDRLARYSKKALVSGSVDKVVHRVADHQGGFDHVKGSDTARNLTGEQKAAYLKEVFPQGFDYVGDGSVDIPVWRSARKAFAYNVSDATLARAKAQGLELDCLKTRPSEMAALLQGMRPHQWSKNGLLLVTPLLNIGLFQPYWLTFLVFGLIALCMVTSATYLLNDLLDIEADRAHATKRNRPFASGELSIPTGALAIAVLGLVGLLLAFALNIVFGAAVGVYAALSLLYSFKLKKVPVFDTFALSFLFCWRVVAGGVLLGLSNSVWFMVAIGFFFLGLALGKRVIELNRAKSRGTVVMGRGYHSEDIDVIKAAGLASSFVMVVIILIYALLEQSTVISREISGVILAATFLIWQLRFWLLVGRDEVHDDPIVFALKDRTSLLVLLGVVLIVLYEQIIPAVI